MLKNFPISTLFFLFIGTLFLFSSCGVTPILRNNNKREKEIKKSVVEITKSADKKVKSLNKDRDKKETPQKISVKKSKDKSNLEKAKEFITKLPAKKLKHSKPVKKYCRKINKKFYHWGWGSSRCKDFDWHHVRNSVQGTPLIWTTFGDEYRAKKEGLDTTMIFCGVHGDEITPIKFCFDVIQYLEAKYPSLYQDKLIVVAPIINPDSFFKRRPTRTNARKVDINRNFPTMDWKKKAIKLWKKRYKKDKRRFPGKAAFTEPEVVFQVNLIKRYKPNKIISVHAPLTMLDYDGPTLQQMKNVLGSRANQLLKSMSKMANSYRVKDYPFFPGSLGNYAGNERGIPTYTLELPSSDNRKHREYWNLFRDALHTAFLRDFRDNLIPMKKRN